METIITALITGLCVAIPSVWATMSNNKENQKLTEFKIEELSKNTDYKLDELSKKVEKHNKVVERTYELEKRVAILEAEK